MNEKQNLVVYWSRRDFRLLDNKALKVAVDASRAQGIPLLPIFIIEDYMVQADPSSQFGYPSRYFLSRALPLFSAHFINFLILQGKPSHIFSLLSKHFKLQIHVNEDIYPDFYKQVKKIDNLSVTIYVHRDSLTIDKETKTGQGNYYSIFTPFKRAVWESFIGAQTEEKVCLRNQTSIPKNILETIFTLVKIVPSDQQSLLLLFKESRTINVLATTIDLNKYLPLPDLSTWYFDEERALSLFASYLESGNLAHYKENRDSLEKDTQFEVIASNTLYGKTSRMSLALTWGLISARTLKMMIVSYTNKDLRDLTSFSNDEGSVAFLTELIWREFYKYLFYHNQELMQTEFQEKYRGTIEWVKGSVAHARFRAWLQGKTGYPVVDAAMSQLAATGGMHNRSRMIVASILTKNLGVDWRAGQEYFRAALIDLDDASNNGGWQWAASVGADPKPIRIFNAELQAKNHDARGAYQKKWLGNRTYIDPIISHKQGREEALRRYGLLGKAPRDF